MNLYHSEMLALAEKIILQIYKGDLNNRLSGEELVHWYGAFLILGRSFSSIFAEHGITPDQLDEIRDIALDALKTATAKA